MWPGLQEPRSGQIKGCVKAKASLFLFPFMPHVFFPHILSASFPLCNQHKASIQRPSLTASIYSILLEGPPLMPFRGIFPFLSNFPILPYPPLSLPFLPSWDLGQCWVYLRGKPRIFHKASISVFHKAASHDPAAGCQTRPHNSSERSEEAGADGSVWWGGKISGCQWAKERQKRESGKWHLCPFLNLK